MILETTGVIVFGEERRLNEVDRKVASLEIRRAALIDIFHVLIKGTQNVVECCKLSTAGHRGWLSPGERKVTIKLGLEATGIGEISLLPLNYLE